VNYIRQAYPEKAREVDIAAFADGQINGYSVTAETFPDMVGVGDLARGAWTQIFTLGKTPVSDMSQVCQQIEAIQKKGSASLPLGGVALAGDPSACDCGTSY
jgi:hypothetical protein